MIFPTSNINMYYVAPKLGYGKFIKENGEVKLVQQVRLSTLCTTDRINPYSRRRPGYWKESGMELVFQKPRGNGYTDPRGTRPTGDTGEVYALGDFRGYNTEPTTPGFEGGDREVHNGSNDTHVDMDLRFFLGEVDWFNEEGDYHGKNFFGRTYTHLHVVLIQGSTRTIVGTVARSAISQQGRNLTAHNIPVSISLPTTGNEFQFTYRAALGTSDHAYAYFPTDGNGQVTITVTRSEQLYYVITSTANSALAAAVSGPSGSLVAPAFYGNSGNIVGANDYVDVKGFRVELVYTDGKRYIITTMRWKVGGELRLVNSAGTTIRTARLDNVTMAYYGEGGGENTFYCFRLDFSALNLGASRDGYRIQWFLDTFDPCTAIEYNP